GAALMFGGLAGQAMALSCLRPDVARTYAEAAEAEAAYVVVHGELDFDAGDMPPAEVTEPAPESRELRATLHGKGLTEGGFDTPFTRPITLEAQCLGPWCAQAEPGVEVLAFVETTGDGYRLTITPCGGMAFQEPSEADIDRVVACYQGKACAPEG
ncbi:MAG: hypothetical protein ACU0B8_14860, partial [Pseudooceanicola nanhaiensis]